MACGFGSNDGHRGLMRQTATTATRVTAGIIDTTDRIETTATADTVDTAGTAVTADAADTAGAAGKTDINGYECDSRKKVVPWYARWRRSDNS